MLKELREAKGLSQEDLARKAKVTRPYVTMLESGVKKNPSRATLKLLAKALGVPLMKLLLSDEELVFVARLECEKCGRETVVYRYDQPGVYPTEEMRKEILERSKQLHEQDCRGRPGPAKHPVTRRFKS